MNIETIYIEEEVLTHPRVVQTCKRFANARKIIIERYAEVFNRKNQDFRSQKEKSALILAKKHGEYLHKVPNNYGIGSKNNYYFSHLLNCPFDCQYCFLQGMYRSAHYVWFVNFEDFQTEIRKKEADTTFFSGYDGDSLALESVTHFAEEFLPFFERVKGTLELRTKSLFLRPLLERDAIPNVVIAFSLNPEEVVKSLEWRTPSLDKRLQAMEKLQKKGWKVGLRFDPLIAHENFEANMRAFFEKVFSSVQKENLHSVTLGTIRLPKPFFRVMQKQHKKNKALALLFKEEGLMGYPQQKRESMIEFCTNELLKFTQKEKLFACA